MLPHMAGLNYTLQSQNKQLKECEGLEPGTKNVPERTRSLGASLKAKKKDQLSKLFFEITQCLGTFLAIG